LVNGQPSSNARFRVQQEHPIGADLRVIGGILVSWLITVPTAAILAAMIFHILRAVFG